MTSYDISVDDGSGQRFKIYNQPESIVRELGLRTVEEQGQVDRLARQVKEVAQGLTIAVADAAHRVDLLERDHRSRVSDDLPVPGVSTMQAMYDDLRYERGGSTGDHKPLTEGKPDEYYVKVDRRRGTVDQER